MARAPRAKQLGVTDDQYERLLAAQGGVCPITRYKPGKRRFHVDHKHGTKIVRGLISYKANRFLLHSWVTAAMLRRAADYLDGSYRYLQLPDAQAVLDEINGVRQDGGS